MGPRKLLGVAAAGVWEAELLSRRELTVIARGVFECCSHCDNDRLEAALGQVFSLIQFPAQEECLQPQPGYILVFLRQVWRNLQLTFQWGKTSEF